MTGSGSAMIVIHLTTDPDAPGLLALELAEAGVEAEVYPVDGFAALHTALDEGLAQAVIADLPLDLGDPQIAIERLRSHAAHIPVIFRWGSPGNWTVEDPSAQLARAVRRAVEVPERWSVPSPDRLQLLGRLAVVHEAHLRLQRSDLWSWEIALKETTETIGGLIGVARVSVWLVSADRTRLQCEDLFESDTGIHHRGEELIIPPRYFEALAGCLTIDATDALSDQRTRAFAEDYLVPRRIRSMLDAAIRRGGEVVGVVCLEHVGDTPRTWNILDRCTATATAAHVARALDVRDRRLVEEKLHASAQAETTSRIASTLAHDFNNTLQVVLGAAEIGRMSRPDDPLLQELTETITKSVTHAQAVLRGLLDFARPAPPRMDRIDLKVVLTESENLLRALFPRAVEVDLEPPPLGTWVRADGDRLRQVLVNLAANARDAMPTGGTFRVRTHAASHDGETWHEITVQDTGEGMDALVAQHAFDPFFTTKPTGRGTGLGLFSVARIIAEHHGSIAMESAPGKGTAVRIRLPRDAESC